jgi:dienelactone hydrolase
MKLFLISICIFSFANILSAQQTKPDRPQTPKPPYTYNADSVEYDNADKTVHFGATFTYPKTGGPFITLLMITGSGLQDRDETIFNHKPFAVIADYLTKKGYAVLRVDDRQKGKSTGEVKAATSADFANDVLASFNYLLTRKEVNKNKIGLIGHSEGGFIAPLVYTKNSKVAFIISLAGTGVSGAQILLKQQTDPVKGLVSDASFNAYYLLTKNTLQVIHDNASLPDSLILNKIKTLYTDWKNPLPDSVLAPLHADAATPEMYATQIKSELIPWLKYFISTDPSQFWDKVKCPVLALNGEKDIQVDASENIPAIAAALQKAGNKNVTTKIFPGLNHLFQHCTKCTVPEYNELTETFAQEALDEIGNWLDATIKK